MAAKNGDLAINFPDFRRLCSHRLLKAVKFLTQIAILNSGSPDPLTPCGAASQSNHLPPVNDFSPVRSKSDRLLVCIMISNLFKHLPSVEISRFVQ